MSQSPAVKTLLKDDGSYIQGWNRLAALAAAGHSFSGHERNCCFLNTAGGEKFADVSSVTGLDFPDDGRGIGLVDWDHDGDLDLWIYNRTAPLLRLLRNDVPQSGKSIAFQLEGRQCNRDAIGARLTLDFTNTVGEQQRKIRTVRAGSGFLSQSSKWAHFGLGNQPTLERLTVDWPGGDREEFTGLSVGSRCRIVQGSGVVEPLPNTPRKLALYHALPKVPAMRIDGRGVISNRKPFPELAYQDFSSNVHEFIDLEGPVLVNLWASWCQPCMKELGDFAEHYDEIKAAGLKILALSTDGLGGPGDPGSQRAASNIVARSNWPFATGFATNDLMMQLTAWHNSAYVIRQSLPAPTSLLIDRHGQIAVIYKGPLSVEQLIEDVSLLDLRQGELVSAALPFPGKFGVNIYAVGLLKFARASLQGSYFDHAKQLVLEFLDREKEAVNFSRQEDSDKRRLEAYELLIQVESGLGNLEAEVDAWRQMKLIAPELPQIQAGLAVALRNAGKVEESRAELERLSQKNSRSGAIQRLIALTCLQFGDRLDAVDYFQRAVQLEPENLLFQIGLASILLADQQISKAIEIYEGLLEKHPNSPVVANNLAWILCTSADGAFRNGKRAIELAKLACQASKYKSPSHLGTLAAAFAESEDFESAIETSQQAVSLLKDQGRLAEVAIMQSRIKTFLDGQPYREGSGKSN